MSVEREIVVCIDAGNGDVTEIGFIIVKNNILFADLRRELELDGLEELEGKTFVFLGEKKLPLSKRQEDRHKFVADQVLIRIVGCEDQDGYPEVGDHPKKRRRLVVSEVEEEINVDDYTIEVEGVDGIGKAGQDFNVACEAPEFARLLSKKASTAQTNRWKHAYRKYKMKMKNNGKIDRFEIMSMDVNGVAVFSLWCVECDMKYGKGEEDMMYNFTARHLEMKEHKLNLKHRQGLENNPDSEPHLKSHEEVVAENRAAVELCMSTKVTPFVEQYQVKFELFEDTVGGYAKSEEICIKCMTCNRALLLFPNRGDLIDNMKEHIKSNRHVAAKEKKENKENKCNEPKKGGRPAKEVNGPGQKSMLTYFTKAPSSIVNVESQASSSRSEYLASLCWGFWQLEYRYGTKKRDLRPYLDDSKAGYCWYSEPKLKAKFQIGDEVVEVDGAFRHVSCCRVNIDGKRFPNFQCSYCALIPKERDFRMRVYRQDGKTIERGQRDIKTCTRVDFLTYTELLNMAKDNRLENRFLKKELTFSKKRNVALSVKVRTLRESLSESMNRKDARKFCNDIREAHSQGKFDGKAALWNFLTDIAQNILRPEHKKRYNQTTKELFETIRIWGGKRMHNFLTMNFCGPSLSTTIRSTRKNFTYRVGIVEVTFIHLAKVYAKHMADLGLKAGCIPTLVAEDETVIKRSVYWNAKDDCLVGFCGISKNHACEPSFIVQVGTGEAGYKMIVDAFEKNVIAHYARVFIINPLHARLPKLVLAIQLTCNKFDSRAMRAQWEIIIHSDWKNNLNKEKL